MGFIAMATFNNLGPFNYESPMVMWIIYFFVNGAMVVIYAISQIILVVYTLDDRWPLGGIIFGALFFGVGQIMMYIFSVTICDQSKHFLDGLFFGSGCNLLAVMMIYKYWDSITKEDLEFALDSRRQYWQAVTHLNEEDEKQAYGFP